MFFRLAYKSLLNRKSSVLLTIMAMTVSIFVLLGVEHIRHQAKDSFANTVSGVDLIVGSRTGSLNLLLYSVFRIGSPTNNISWSSFQEIANNSKVKWAIPISLGDSHKGYRVMGTSQDYFEYFSYGNKHKLGFKKGGPFYDLFDVMLGSDVAKKLGYSIEDKLVLAHGIAKTSFSLHDDRPFTVVGILKPTGTPIDQTLHISLKAIDTIHIDWKHGVKMSDKHIPITQLEKLKHKPKSITAFMLGLNSRMATFSVQRDINHYRKEPLTAVLPGVALSELWQMMNILENTLRLISVMILIAALLGLSAMLLASIRERSHEVQLLRVIGASPLFLFFLIELEALMISLVSIILGASLVYVCLTVVSDMLASSFGLHIDANFLSKNSLYLLLLIVASTLIAAAIPYFSIYKNASSV